MAALFIWFTGSSALALDRGYRQSTDGWAAVVHVFGTQEASGGVWPYALSQHLLAGRMGTRSVPPPKISHKSTDLLRGLDHMFFFKYKKNTDGNQYPRGNKIQKDKWEGLIKTSPAWFLAGPLNSNSICHNLTPTEWDPRTFIYISEP